ncbi:MAG: glucosidase [Planctomycetota bacterium]|nr:MAG: glucosidase [Planctomycetota bacterium]
MTPETCTESQRLLEEAEQKANWKRWGPYLPERQWGTVREDYSDHGNCWDYFPHEHARSRAYRWGEDGLLGWCDRQCRLCFAVSLWNGKDGILKERLFGLTNDEGNHGEDVKEVYFYLDSTPTHSYAKALYRYPQREFPYDDLVAENGRRGKDKPEYELTDTGVFEGNRFFDVTIEYAKASDNDTLVEITAHNHGPEAADLHLLPTVWFRNTWSWGAPEEGVGEKPRIWQETPGRVLCEHETLGRFAVDFGPGCGGAAGPEGDVPELLFTENETNFERIFGYASAGPYVKDGFQRRVVGGETGAVNPARHGTKAGAWHRLRVGAGESVTVRVRIRPAEIEPQADDLAGAFDEVIETRRREADEFYAHKIGEHHSPEQRAISRQAFAGLLWGKQFYHYVVKDWLAGDPSQPPPPESRRLGRNHDWSHLHSRDILSIPDTWEYPWFAAWDTAFHMVPMARIDPDFAKRQLVLMLREWYMHPNGQMPAYEFAFGDVNPPVHAWACWRVYQRELAEGRGDRLFLSRTFQKLLLNFTWWVNRKDPQGENIFSGGFLGLDNIGVFDRSQPLPIEGKLEQADATAWMAFFCGHMLSMAMELAIHNPAYEDMASKFFEHFVHITDAMNTLGGTGLWDEKDGFYYDRIRVGDTGMPMRIRSLVGILPMIACEILEERVINQLPGFAKRMNWFLENRSDLARHTTYMEPDGRPEHAYRLLALPSRERLVRMLGYLLDEKEFLSPFGIRSLSKIHATEPFIMKLDDQEFRVEYAPGESPTQMFGGNSNWRGPIWFPINYMIVKSLERYHRFYGDALQVECPTGSGNMMNLWDVSQELRRRLARLFEINGQSKRPFLGGEQPFVDSAGEEMLFFHEFFHGDTGKGLGASHQTGWTALISSILAGTNVRTPPRATAAQT